MPMRPLHLAAVLGVTLAAGVGANGEVTYRQYSTTAAYGYNIKHMPDFDQRRMANGGISGLPNNGGMYCAPTSIMNICAYIASHGYPTVPPQDYNWLNPGNYDVATGSLFILGLLSNTSATNGTSGAGWLAGANAWVPLDLFTVQMFYPTSNWWPRRWDLAQSVYNGSMVAMSYGFYETVGNQQGVPVVNRAGGHCVTLTGMLSGTTPFPFITVRDPADDGANSTQSTFSNRQFYTKSHLVFSNGQLRAVDNLSNEVNGPLGAIFDGYVQIRPKAGVTWSEPEQLFIITHTPNLQGSLYFIDPIPSPPGPPSEWTLAPEQNLIYALLDEGVGEQQMYQFSLATGEVTPMDVWAFDPHDMVTSPTHQIYVAQGSQVVQVDATSFPPDPVNWLTLSGPVMALAFDDGGRMLHVYNSELHAIQTYDANLEQELYFMPLPAGVGNAETTDIAYDKQTNSVWVVSNFEPMAWRIPVGDSGAAQGYPLADATHVTSIDVDDQGHLFVSDNGVMREYRPTKGGAYMPHVGPLDGMATGETLYITKCRTNFDPEFHTEGWHHVLPNEEQWGLLVPDCVADIDTDGEVGFGDLILLLATWGPCSAEDDCVADLDGDQSVTFADLLILLASYGPCPT